MNLLGIFECNCIFLAISVLISLFYGVRGALWHAVYVVKGNAPWHWQWFVLWYIQDFIYNFVCSMAGFFALRVLSGVLKNGATEISVGGGILFGFLTIIAILGISGSLPRILFRGGAKF